MWIARLGPYNRSVEFRKIRHGVVDSTSERAFASLAAREARHGDVHLAAAQTAGRGRLGRAWHSAPGEGLYASIVLLPGPPPWSGAALTIALGLATLDAVRDLGLEDARLKWPNDVVVRSVSPAACSFTLAPGSEPAHGDAKLAGVLAETRGLDPRAPHYVAGIGINVAQRAFPRELLAERAVTSLALCAIDASVEQACDALLARLPARLDSIRRDPDELARDFTDAAKLRDAKLCVETSEGELVARLEALSIASGLRLRRDDGLVRSIPLELVREIRLARASSGE